MGLRQLIDAMVLGDDEAAQRMLREAPALATAVLTRGATRLEPKESFYEAILHYVYAGDTALHMAAAAHRPSLTRKLISLGADVAARNRRGATPLHYAVDGGPGMPGWRPRDQAATVTALIKAGADPNAADKGSTRPLHRATRNRCAAAVRALLEGGADPKAKNKSGATAAQLAATNTGRGGSGSPEARAQQAEISKLLRET
jgi:hypothetical protein